MVIQKNDIDGQINLLVQHHEQKANHSEVEQALYELHLDWKLKEIETIKANIKYLRYKRDTDELCKFLFTLSSNFR